MAKSKHSADVFQTSGSSPTINVPQTATRSASEIVSTIAASRYIGVSKKTLLKYCRRREITFMIYPSGEYRFRTSSLDIWLAKRTYQSKAA